MADWQPIETAPLDGSEFLGYGSYLYPGDADVTEYWMVIQYRRNSVDGEFPWTDGHEAMKHDFFSHWQPLDRPTPPAEV